MLTTYRIISNFQEIGECEGIPGADNKGSYIFFSPEQRCRFSLGDFLVTPDEQYIELYYEELAHKNDKLSVAKVYYR